MLKRIEAFLKAHGRTCLADIAAHLGAPESAVKPMLELLERKGKVRRVVMSAPLCAGCNRCAPGAREEWTLANGEAD